MPAPSPRTNPSLALSNGRDARSGSSLRVDMARMTANAPMFSGMMAASVPPASTTSARPARIMAMPYPIASAPEAQALTSECAPARALNSMLIQPADPFGIGTVYGEMRCQPLLLSVSYAASVEPMPPIPLVTATPSRSGSGCGEPASAQASRAATSANCSQRSIRRACTRPTASAGSAAACAAMRTGRSRAHGSVIARTPLRPASIAAQVDATSPPSGVVAPSPVTTTVSRSRLTPCLPLAPGPSRRRRLARSRRAAGVLGDVGDHVLDGGEVLELVVGYLDAELVLGGDGDLDHRQRVDVEVVDEALARRHLVGGHAGDLLDDLGEPGEDLLVCH